MVSSVLGFFKQNWLKFLLIIAIFVVSYFFSNVYIKEVDFFARDFLQYFNTSLNSTISKDITIVDIDSNTESFSSPLRYSELEKLLLTINKYEPKAVLLNIEPLEYTSNLEERKKLRKLLEDNVVYLSGVTKSRFGKWRFFDDPVFKNYNFNYSDSLTLDELNGYHSPRRMLLKYYGQSDKSTISDALLKLNINIKSSSQFEYGFERMNTWQIFNKFYKLKNFNLLNAQNIINNSFKMSQIKDKILIIGRIDEFSFMGANNPLNLLGKSQASSNLEDNIIPLHHIVASHISTLQTGDYVKYLNGKHLHILISLILVLLFIIRIDVQLKLIIFLLILPSILVFQILLYSFSSFYIDMVPTYIMLISIQYLAIPLILLAMFKEKELQKLQDVSNARIDALLSVSEKVAHDIRSPLGAINLIMSRTKFENFEHKEIVEGALKRIDETAENILAKYKVRHSSENTFESVDVVQIVSKLIAEKRILDSQIEYVLDVQNDKIFVLAFSIELERVISNIIDNSIFALKHRNPKLIKISIGILNSKAVIKIHDNGIGIPSNVLKLLGYQQITTKAGQNGNGIGLLHAKRTVERMQGIFQINSVENQYTNIEIRLKIS